MYKTEQYDMDSKNIPDDETEINGRKTNVNFPLSFLDFLNYSVDKTRSKNDYDDNPSCFITQSWLKKDEKMACSSGVDRETSDLDDTTLSDDEVYLPTYKSLYERIKRHSFQDNLFKCSPGKEMPEARPKSTFPDNNDTLAGQSAIKCESNTCYNSFQPTTFEPLNTIEAKPSFHNTISIIVTNDVRSDKKGVEHSDNEDKSSISGRVRAFNGGVDKETLSKTVCADDQSKGLMTLGSVKNEKGKAFNSVDDKETSDLDDTTLSDDEVYLPTYKSLFERIKRHSSQDNLFKCSPGREMPEARPKSTFANNNDSSTGRSAIKCVSSEDDESKTTYDSFLPTKFEPLNTIETKQSESALTTVSITVRNDLRPNKQRIEHSDNEDKSSIIKLKQLVMPPVDQPALLASEDLRSNKEKKEKQEEEEINLADLQRICYKAMVFQQTGQVPVDCNSKATESYSSSEELNPNPKNPRPCLCRFYCKKKCKKDRAKPSVQRPCRVGKGYASDKRNKGNSSCACKLLPNSRPNVDKKTIRMEIGESSNTKSAGTCDIVFVKNNTVGKTKLRNQNRAGTIEKSEENTKKYLIDLAAKTKLLAKLELSENRMKRLANYDASLPLFSGMVPVDEDGIRDGSISLSDDDSVHEQKENIAVLSRPWRHNLDTTIDLTADSPPRSPVLSGSYKFNQIAAKPKLNKRIKADPEVETSCKTNRRQTPTVGRYGVAMGAIYSSDSSDEFEISSGQENKRERNLSTEPLQNAKKSVFIRDSDEESTPDVLFKPSVATTSQSMELPKPSVFKHITQNSFDVASSLDNQSLATKSNHNMSILGQLSSVVKCNDNHLQKNKSDANEQIVTSKDDEWSYYPATSGLEDILAPKVCPHFCSCCTRTPTSSELPMKELKRALKHEIGDHDGLNTNNNNVDTSVSNKINSESSSHSVMDWKELPFRSSTTYEDVLASYAAYDSDDDDRMSFTMGSPQSPECLVNEDPSSPIKSEESEQNAHVPETNEFTPLPSTSATPGIVLPSNRVLRIRTTPRITQKMIQNKRTVKRVVTTPRMPLAPDNCSTSGPSLLDIPTKNQKGMARKILSPQPPLLVAVDNGIKKAKVVVETRSANEDNESTPERAKLKQEISTMASKLKKVTALAARAAQLEKVAMDAKQKELLAVRKAQEASEILKAERLEHKKVLKEAKEKMEIEKQMKAREEEKERKKAASDANAKLWECPVCLEPGSALPHMSVTPCGHVFCKPCILEVGQSKGLCPLCNKVFTNAQVTPLFFNFPS